MKLGEKIRSATGKSLRFLGKHLSGDTMLNHGIERYLGFAVYAFFLVCLAIAWNLVVENDLVKVQDNARKIESLKIEYHQKELDYIGINSRSRINGLLKSYGSTLREPSAPPQRIKKEEGEQW